MVISPAIVVGLHRIFPNKIFTLGAYMERLPYRICNFKSNGSYRRFCVNKVLKQILVNEFFRGPL